MARGWESKSVEQQQDDARSPAIPHKLLSPEQLAKEKKREVLELSRKHVMQQLELATNVRHRQMLEAALKAIETQLRKDA